MATALIDARRPSFELVYDDYKPKLRQWARRQYVRGMPVEDIASEMSIELWRSWTVWDPDEGDIHSLFCVYWRNRRSSLNRNANRTKRAFDEYPLHELTEERQLVLVNFDEWDIPECPEPDARCRRMWRLIAAGYTSTEIIELLGIERWQYHWILRQWAKRLSGQPIRPPGTTVADIAGFLRDRPDGARVHEIAEAVDMKFSAIQRALDRHSGAGGRFIKLARGVFALDAADRAEWCPVDQGEEVA